jgi:hypothetical protein
LVVDDGLGDAVSVLRRCSIDSISHWAALILRLMNSRSSGVAVPLASRLR